MRKEREKKQPDPAAGECVSNQESGQDARHDSRRGVKRYQPGHTATHGDARPSEAHVGVAASAPLLPALEVKRPVIGRKPSFLKAEPYITAGMRRQEGGGEGAGGCGGGLRGGEGEGGRPRCRKPFHFDTAVSREASTFHVFLPAAAREAPSESGCRTHQQGQRHLGGAAAQRRRFTQQSSAVTGASC